jgi:hypothetical protein
MAKNAPIAIMRFIDFLPFFRYFVTPFNNFVTGGAIIIALLHHRNCRMHVVAGFSPRSALTKTRAKARDYMLDS